MELARPRIGITCRFDHSKASYRLDERYVRQVILAGGLPLIVPFESATNHASLLGTLDGLLLSGGEDIHPDLSGGGPVQNDYTYYPERDRFELSLASQAISMGLPILGICRGSQILCVASGGMLIPDLPNDSAATIRHRIDRKTPSTHAVTLLPGSRVAEAHARVRLVVTSYHHQGIRVDDAAETEWRVTARSDDGAVEAIERIGDTWIVGALWHPEILVEESTTPSLLIAQFVREGRRAYAY
ncbi:gamma-glutamyl-gamma-aminobutyrate hydrolase family protein [Leifsonia aquatica]|uniref:gamma-glutamyl-gamma-aminobutyrate hydrolase family protein n=1 Tax=Leifsonia aquatica TaxID=144185 RepID=UPI00384DCBD2